MDSKQTFSAPHRSAHRRHSSVRLKRRPGITEAVIGADHSIPSRGVVIQPTQPVIGACRLDLLVFRCKVAIVRLRTKVSARSIAMPLDGRCRWCRKPMPDDALICTECGRHDSQWFEYGKALLTIASVAGVLFSAAVYVSDPVQRIVSAILFEPGITIESFRTERSARIRNDAGRSVFLTRYEVSIPLESIDDDKLIPDGQIARTFDLIEQEIPPGRSVQLETLSLAAQRAMHLKGNGTVTPVPSIEVASFPYVHQYRDSEAGHVGRILFYADGDPELIGRVADVARRDALPKGTCGIYYTAEFSSVERHQPFECRAVAGFIGEFDAAMKGYLTWQMSTD